MTTFFGKNKREFNTLFLPIIATIAGIIFNYWCKLFSAIPQRDVTSNRLSDADPIESIEKEPVFSALPYRHPELVFSFHGFKCLRNKLPIRIVRHHRIREGRFYINKRNTLKRATQCFASGYAMHCVFEVSYFLIYPNFILSIPYTDNIHANTKSECFG